MLAARSEGIGLGWVSILDPGATAALLDVPAEWRFIGHLCIGYPADEAEIPELERAGWEQRRPPKAAGCGADRLHDHAYSCKLLHVLPRSCICGGDRSRPLPTLPDQRQTAILDRLARDGRVLASDLASEFDTSEDTIRRDLRELAAAGRCRRVYGGALPAAPTAGPVARRNAVAPDGKRALGRAAAALVEPGWTVLIDSGSTNLRIAEALPADRDMTVVTNAPAVAATLAGRPRCTLVVLGGRVHPDIGAAFGPRTLRDLEGVWADIAFVGACGLASGPGLTVFDAEEAEFKRRLLAVSARRAVALTADKLGTAAPFVVAPAADLQHLVVEADASGAALDALAAGHLRIHRADPV